MTIRWPFISRAHHDLALSQLAYFRNKAEQWEARYLERTAPPTLPKVDVPVDEVAKAIRLAAGGNSALRAHLVEYARDAKAKGTPEADILGEIRGYATGETPKRTPKVSQAERDEANAAVAELLADV